MVYETQPSHAASGGYGRVRARLLFTVLGIAALLVGAVLNWEGKLAGNKLTLRSLIQDDFTTRSDVLRTVGAASVLIAAVALLGLLDRSGRLTRLAGFAAVVLFAMFAVQVFRHYGEDYSTSYHALRPGAWCQLGAGVLLLLGGLIRYRRRSERPATATKATTERGAERAPSTADTVVQRPVAPAASAPLDGTEPDGTEAGPTRDEPTWRDEEQSDGADSGDDGLSEDTGAREPVVRGLGS